MAPNPRSEWSRPADTRVASRTARGPSHERVGLRARDSVQRIARTWTATAETDECLGSKRAAAAALTRTVTGALLAPDRTQRTAEPQATGMPLPCECGRESFAPIDPGGEMVTRVLDAVRYQVYRVFGFRDRPRLFSVRGAIAASWHLEPTNYLARLSS